MDIYNAKTAREYVAAWRGLPRARLYLSVAAAAMEANAAGLEWAGKHAAGQRRGYLAAARILVAAAAAEPGGEP